MTRLAFISPLALAACAPPVPVAEDFIPEYLGVETTELGDASFQLPILDFYLTNPIARASELMAELSANAKARKQEAMAAE